MTTATARPTVPISARDFKSDYNPIWCPGCGDYSVVLSFTRAFASLGLRTRA